MTIVPYSGSHDASFLHHEPRKHTHRTTIQHWQLRDLIVSPSTQRELFFVTANNIRHLDTYTGEASPILKDLSFSPASLTIGCNYLAAGGQRSQLTVRSLSGSWSAHSSVGGSINNALAISHHEGTGTTRLYVCNNDQSIKVFRLPDLERVATIPLPTAVNHASISPDGKNLAAVGDTNEVFLIDISNSGDYRRNTTLYSTKDAGFSCAWNQNSEKLAVATQDGYVCVWDIRGADKLAKIATKQGECSKGAARCVKFSPFGSVDLLMFSEVQ